MRLSALIPNLSPEVNEIEITDLTLDSRLVKPGNLFFACVGTAQDGRQFIEVAIKAGAAAIVAEGQQEIIFKYHVPIISVPELNKKVSRLAAAFYEYPEKKIPIVGITGTSGKTSCSYFIASIWQHLGKRCGLMGTLGNGLFGQLTPSALTTPDAITIQKNLVEFVRQKASLAVMEVSSHSLDQGRVEGMAFSIGLFTNLSRDHLDYHGTMENYGAAKKRLFEQSRQCVINLDDPFGAKLLKPHHLSYSVKNPAADIFATHIQLSDLGMSAEVSTPWGTGKIQTTLMGEFNLSNVLATLGVLGLLEVPLDEIFNCFSHLKPVPGRMQLLGGGKLPLVVVDYAHKPDALQKVLLALRAHCEGTLYCVFGCGGNRDAGKRPMMAAIAERYADRVIVTDDNPRHEDPAQIARDIMAGFVHSHTIILQHDRSKAIHDVIQCALAGDCILIAGKGAETYQMIGDAKYPFDDTEQVLQALSRKNQC